jgi:hypothetical protein
MVSSAGASARSAGIRLCAAVSALPAIATEHAQPANQKSRLPWWQPGFRLLDRLHGLLEVGLQDLAVRFNAFRR